MSPRALIAFASISAACASATSNTPERSSTEYRTKIVWEKPAAGCPSDAHESTPHCMVCDVGRKGACDALCSGGNGDACALLGTRVQVADKDDATAGSLFEKACALDSGSGCESLGLALMRGRGIARDEKRAADLFERMCNAGRPRGCTFLAEALFAARGRPKDDAQAVQLLEGSCRERDPEACQLLKDPHVGDNIDAAVAGARKRIIACDGADDEAACERAE